MPEPYGIETAGSFGTGNTYIIVTVADTDFTAIGAVANRPGVVFEATGQGEGSGTARRLNTHLGRIGGKLLSQNLLRNGFDLEFDNNLLYLNVNDKKVSVNTDISSYDLYTFGTQQTSDLLVDDSIIADGLTFTKERTVSPATGDIIIDPSGSTVISTGLRTGDFLITNNQIRTEASNSNIELRPFIDEGVNSTVETYSDLNINGSLEATGDITIDGSITFGDSNTDNVTFLSDINSNIVPNLNSQYRLGSSETRWETIYTTNVNGTSLQIGFLGAGGVDVSLREENTWYVSTNGFDENQGNHQLDTFKTIEKALSVAQPGDTVLIFPGVYEETTPLVVPQGVTVKGTNIRNVVIVPTSSGGFDDIFHLNGETYVESLTIKNFFYDSINDTGYAFRFAPGASITSRSPYIQNITVITSEAPGLAIPADIYVDPEGLGLSYSSNSVTVTQAAHSEALVQSWIGKTLVTYFGDGYEPGFYTITGYIDEPQDPGVLWQIQLAETFDTNQQAWSFSIYSNDGETIIVGTESAALPYDFARSFNKTSLPADFDTTVGEDWTCQIGEGLNIVDFVEEDPVNSDWWKVHFKSLATFTFGPPIFVSPTAEDTIPAGRGALIDGAAVDQNSNEAAMLFHSCTFIVPNADAITMTNGVRVEWLNSFTYFANRGLYALQGTGRITQDGSTRRYGAEIRSIGSANVYGTYGAVADGADTLMYLINHNFAYIGVGTDTTNDNTFRIEENEVVRLNNGKIYFQSQDHRGKFKVGDNFFVDFDRGTTSIDVTEADIAGASRIIVDTRGQITVLDSSFIDTGSIAFSGNVISNASGELNIRSATDQIAIDSTLNISKNFSITGNLSIDGEMFLLGNQYSDTIKFEAEISHSIIPAETLRFELGADDKRWLRFPTTAVIIDDILINNNFIETSSSNADLEFRASGTGKIYTPDNVLIENNLSVGLDGSQLSDLNITGSLTYTGNTIQVGDVVKTGNVDITGDLSVSNDVQLEDIKIFGNVITTTESNSNLRLVSLESLERRRVFGVIRVPSNDLLVERNFTLGGITTTDDLSYPDADFVTQEFGTDELRFFQNNLSSINSNVDIDLRATGDVFIGYNDLVLAENLTVEGSSDTQDITVTGLITHTGNKTQVGNVAQTGTYSITGRITTDSDANFENIRITNNKISTSVTATETRLIDTIENPDPLADHFSGVWGSTEPYGKGNSIEIQPPYLIVGASRLLRTFESKVFVFDLTSRTLLYQIENPGSTTENRGFGATIRANSQYIVVGHINPGAYFTPIYIFNITDGSLVSTISTLSYRGLGNQIILTEDRIIASQSRSYGRVLVFDFSGTLTNTITTPDVLPGTGVEPFGMDMAIHSGLLFICSPRAVNFEGRVYIYDLDTFNLQQTITEPTTNVNFGESILVTDQYLIIGAGGSQVYVFSSVDYSLIRTISNPDAYPGGSGSDNFGRSLDLKENILVVGAPGEDDQPGINTGSGIVYLFDITTGALLKTITNPRYDGDTDEERFGQTVVLYENLLFVGNPDNAQEGVLHVFEIGSDLFDPDGLRKLDLDLRASGTGQIAIPTNDVLIENDLTNSSSIFSPEIFNDFSVTSERFTNSQILIEDNYVTTVIGNQDLELFANISISEIIVPSNNVQINNNLTVSGATSLQQEFFNVSLAHRLDTPAPFLGTTFGSFSIDISGNRCIIGVGRTANGGEAYIFDVVTGDLLHTLVNPNAYGTTNLDLFGSAVGISGDRCIVGAHFEDEVGYTGSGKAYIFDVTTGALLHTLDNPNAFGTPQGDSFGESVAIDGDRAIVGAPFEDDADNPVNPGKAYIFDVTTGALLHTLDSPDPDRFLFALSVSISGNRAIVGNDPGDLAYIFDVATGALLHTLVDPDPVIDSFPQTFGVSVAISGNRAIVGAYLEGDEGKAYIFDVTTGALVHTLDNAYGTSGAPRFGVSVAIDGNRCIVGAPNEHDAGGTFSGKAYIFDVTTGALLHTLDNPNAYSTSGSDEFGYSVAISESYAIVVAPKEDTIDLTDSGKTYIFNLSGVSSVNVDITGSLLHTGNRTQTGNYQQTGNINISGAVDFDRRLDFENISIDGNVITTLDSNSDLELRAAGSRSVILDGASARLLNDLYNGSILYSQDILSSKSGYTTRVSSTDFNVTELDFASNEIKITAADENLLISSTGIISVPTTDVIIENDLTVDVDTDIKNLEILGDLTHTGNRYTYGDYTHVGVLNISGKITADRIVRSENIQLDDNVITTTRSNADLELAANSLGTVTVLTNDVQLDQDLEVQGTTALRNLNATGDIVQTGNTTHTGNFSIAGEITNGNILIEDNFITTTEFDIEYGNLIINGTFDTDLTGWVNYTLSVAEVVDGVARISGGLEGTLSQTVTVQPNTDYTISVDMVTAGADATSSNLYVSGVTTLVNQSLLNTTGTTVAATFNSGANTSVTVMFQAVNGDLIEFDNVELVQVTETDYPNLVLGANGVGTVHVDINDVIINNDLYQNRIIFSSDIDTQTATLTSNTFLTDNLEIVDNFIKANTGDLIVASTKDLSLTSSTEIDNDLTVSGESFLKDVNVTGSLTQTGTRFQIGNYQHLGIINIDGNIIGDRAVAFESILIDDNFITTTESNDDLILRAAGTGKIVIPTNDVVISNDLTVGAAIEAGQMLSQSTVDSDVLTTGDLTITNNQISTTLANSDLELYASLLTSVSASNAATLQPGDFSNGFSSVGVSSSYLLVAIPAGIYTITISDLTLAGGIGAQVLLSTDQDAIDAGNPGVFANFGLDEFSPGPTTYTFTNVTSTEPFYIIFDASTGELTATGVSYSGVISIPVDLGRVYVPNNDVQIDNDLTVSGSSQTKSLVINGLVTQTGDRVQQGTLDHTGDYLITGKFTSNNDAIFEDIKFQNNVIIADVDLELAASGTGQVKVSTDDVIITDDLSVAQTIYSTAISTPVSVTSGSFTTGDINITANEISTTDTDSDLVLQSTRNIVVQTTDTELDSDLTVEGLTSTRNVEIQGSVTHTGSKTFTGSYVQTGNTDISNDLTVTQNVIFEDIRIAANNITTTDSNSNLELAASGTGSVEFDVDTLIQNNLRINRVTSLNDLTVSQVTSAERFNTADQEIYDNRIQTTRNDLPLQISALSGSVNAENIRILNNKIFTDTGKDLVFATAEYIDITGTNAVKLPAGTTAQKTRNTAGDLRFNSTESVFEGYYQSRIGFGGIYSDDKQTNVTAHPFDNVLRFKINGTQVGYIVDDLFSIHGIQIEDKLSFQSSTITNLEANGSVNLVGNSVILENSLIVNDSDITNTLDTPLIFRNTGTGYVSFADGLGFVIPVGDTDARSFVEVGDLRYNIDLNDVEVYNGTEYQALSGDPENAEVDAQAMGEITNEWSLILG